MSEEVIEQPAGVIMNLVPETHKLLSTRLDNFDFQNPPLDPVQLSYDLVATMRARRGLGLSANQVGLPYRVFTMEAKPALACFNPVVVDVSEELVELEEGCLSYPGLIIKIKRPRHIKVRYTEPNGNVVTKKFTGMSARCFLHEHDHMEGVNFLSRVSELKRSMATKRYQKLVRARSRYEQLKLGDDDGN